MSEPTIVVFSGPSATVTNSPPLVTSDKGRTDDEQSGQGKYDHLVPQYLHEPVVVKIQKFTGHPLEEDASEVYHETDDEYYEVTLRPDDGLYLLPYVARRADGSADGIPFEASDMRSPELSHGGRQFFYPDASRLFEEIDRTITGRTGQGTGNTLGQRANYEFVRALPPGGYTSRGEELGRDYFPYEPVKGDPRLQDLARVANVVQEKVNEDTCDGALWLEGSSRIEETIYWLSLLVETDLPIAGVVSNRKHGTVSNDGDRNVIDAVDYLVSGKGEGLGAVCIQDQLIYPAREFKKVDDRPGGFTTTGGLGGPLGSIKDDVRIHFTTRYRHTSESDVNLSSLPTTVEYFEFVHDDAPRSVEIKTPEGALRGDRIPRVSLLKYCSYSTISPTDNPDEEVDIMARIQQAEQESATPDGTGPVFHGLVFEGTSPYANPSPSQLEALHIAAHSGIPVVRVGRSDPGGFVPQRANDTKPLIVGSNFHANKARMLLIACLLKLGPLPRAENPREPTEPETDAIRSELREYQAIFDTH